MSRRNDLLVLAELTLAGLTVAAVLGIQRLFVDSSFVAPLLLQVALAHTSLAMYRRLGLKLGRTALLTAVTAILAITWSQYPDTLWVLLPSGQSWDVMWHDVDHAAFVFNDVSAPAPVEPGFILIAAVFVWVLAFVADWGAFRTNVSFESLLPSATLFLFAAVLGYETPVGWSASLYAAAALLFLLVHRTWRQEAGTGWTGARRRRSRRSLLATGGVLAFAAVVVGSVVSPQLPGAADAPAWDWRGVGEGDDTRVVISPLIDVRGRMVEQSDLEVFTVRTDDESGAYWRLTSLDSFDGRIWGSTYQTDTADGELPRAVPSEADARQVNQDISISALDQIWLPAAYEPVAFDGQAPVVYDERSATLITDRSEDSSDGMRYTVTSEVPTWTADELRQASDEVPSNIASRYLDLPDDFSEDVAEEAGRIAAGAEGNYDKAMALQAYLRSFTYTLEVPEEHTDDPMVDFLFYNQQGYCEQFAGAFAAMARALDIPSRVVVGFTRGIEDPNEPGLFRVQGKHAHAWVEIYIDGYGWVTFDPTPTRAPPDAGAWLGLVEEQAAEDGDGTGSTTLPPRETGEPDGSGAVDDPNGEPGPNDDVGADAPVQERPSPPATAAPPDRSVPQLVSDTAADTGRRVGPFALAYLLIVPSALLLQRQVRRRRARLASQQVQLAWAETLEQTSLLGVTLTPSMTVNERAVRIQAALPAAAAEVGQVAHTIERSAYAGLDIEPGDAAEARAAAEVVRAEVARRRPWFRRLGDHLDARRLLPRARRARRSAHGVERTENP